MSGFNTVWGSLLYWNNDISVQIHKLNPCKEFASLSKSIDAEWLTLCQHIKCNVLSKFYCQA